MNPSGLNFDLLNIGQDKSGSVDSNSLPSYYTALDSHNYGNQNFAFKDPTTWGDSLDNAGKFVIDAAYSGVNQLYNSAVTVGNWLGGDFKENDTSQGLADLDSSLGDYYKQNSQAIDLAGFVATSFIPGMAGVKLANAGARVISGAARAGILGDNVAGAFGLLKPAAEYSANAAKTISASQGAFDYLNADLLKSLATGVGKQALEGAAFETAVQATMFKSPVLNQQDGLDITSNILTGALLGGAIGGAFEAAKTIGGVKKLVKAADIADKDKTLVTGRFSAETPSETIIKSAYDIEATPAADVNLTGIEATKNVRQIDKRVVGLQNTIRSSVHDLVGKSDPAFGNQVADVLHGLPAQQLEANLFGVEQMARVSAKLPVEKELGATTSIPGTSSNKSIGYIKLQGEGAGDMALDTAPKILSIGDTVKSVEQAKAFVASQQFSVKKLWNPLDADSGDSLVSQARYAWADGLGKDIKNGMTVHSYDIPLQEKILANWESQYKGLQPLEQAGADTKLQQIKTIDSTGNVTTFTNPDDLLRSIKVSKQEVASELMAKNKAGEEAVIQPEAIAKITNVKQSLIGGQISRNERDDLFARQFYANQYTNELISKGLRKASDGPVTDLWAQPSYAKVVINPTPIQGADGHLLNGMAYITAKQKIYQQQIDNVVADQLGPDFARLPEFTDRHVRATSRTGGGPGIAASAQGAYGSPESLVQQIGAVTADVQTKTKEATRASLESVMYGLANHTESAIEWAALHNKVASTAEHYVLADDGNSLMIRSVKQYQDAIAAGEKNIKQPVIQPGAPVSIPIQNQQTKDAVVAYIASNGKRQGNLRDIQAAQGLTNSRDPATFYPLKPDPKNYGHVALVIDPSIASGAANQKSMIHAATAGQLQGMIDRVPSNYQVLTKGELDNYFKANKEFQYELTLNENHIDADLKRNGVNNQFFQQTNPNTIVKSWLDHETKSDDIYVRELINAKYEKQFSELRHLGEQYSNVATSVYNGSYRFVEDAGKNPYFSYIKTALNLNQASSNKYLYGFNQLVDGFVSKSLQPIFDSMSNAKSPTDLDAINTALQKVGAKSAYYDTATNLLANHSAPKGVLDQFVRRANGLLSALTLGFDPLNAVNNAVGAGVLLGSETASLTRAIKNGSREGAGELAGLMNVNIPGMPDNYLAPSKLIGNAYKRFFSSDSQGLKDFYTANGWLTPLSKQISAMHDDLTLVGTDTAKSMDGRINAALDKARVLSQKGTLWSGNKYAEEMNRFVAANVMNQITSVAVKHGIIDQKSALGYINSFVNRTQGTYLASQRPLMFQGAVGQAVGLFQTYQFNLMQQLFRHVAEGSSKDAATLLGLQGTIYGLNGLPAFNYINTHIVGTGSGNPDHRDLYSSTYGVFGKSVGDFLLYGLPSNMLATNLYSRGDINPRQVTVIPTNPADIPIVNAFTTAFGNIKNTADKIAAGGAVWETILQGIEHNGLSRPLAGLAQIAQVTATGSVTATSKQGNIMGSNDLFTLASLSRLAGGRPIDEAIANDAVYRTSVYKAVDKQRMDGLKQAVASTVIGSESPSGNEVADFASQYAALGGKQKQFNHFMVNQIVNTNTPQAEKIIGKLKTPYAQNMQQIMGGRDINSGQDQDTLTQ